MMLFQEDQDTLIALLLMQVKNEVHTPLQTRHIVKKIHRKKFNEFQHTDGSHLIWTSGKVISIREVLDEDCNSKI